VGLPKTYLGAHVKQSHLPEDGTKVQWGLSAEPYIKNAIKNVEDKLKESGQTLLSKKYASTPLSNKYRPELDYTPLISDAANYYQQLIGVLCWIIELGCLDIYIHTAMMSSHMMQPREGHLKELLHIFAYLKHHSNALMIFDDTAVNWDESTLTKQNWSNRYRDAKEELPPNMPELRGNPVKINCFVDADHAGNHITRRSQTGILIFLNRAPIIWYSKAKNTIESSTFGAEFVATKIAVELIEGLRYKLRMFGIPIDGPINAFIDNNSVVLNATIPTSTLKKKHNSIAYHRVCKLIAAGVIRIAKVLGKKNLADMLTKPLSANELISLAHKVLYFPNVYEPSDNAN